MNLAKFIQENVPGRAIHDRDPCECLSSPREGSTNRFAVHRYRCNILSILLLGLLLLLLPLLRNLKEMLLLLPFSFPRLSNECRLPFVPVFLVKIHTCDTDQDRNFADGRILAGKHNNLVAEGVLSNSDLGGLDRPSV